MRRVWDGMPRLRYLTGFLIRTAAWGIGLGSGLGAMLPAVFLLPSIVLVMIAEPLEPRYIAELWSSAPIFLYVAFVGLRFGLVGGFIAGLSTGLLIGIQTITIFYPPRDSWFHRLIAGVSGSALAFGITLIYAYWAFNLWSFYEVIGLPTVYSLLSAVPAYYASQRVCRWYQQSTHEAVNEPVNT